MSTLHTEGLTKSYGGRTVVRGVNLYPSQVEEIVRRHPEVDEFLIEQRTVRSMDEVVLLVAGGVLFAFYRPVLRDALNAARGETQSSDAPASSR